MVTSPRASSELGFLWNTGTESNCQANDESCPQKNRRVHLTAIQS
jgi:hypothetical protein